MAGVGEPLAQPVTLLCGEQPEPSAGPAHQLLWALKQSPRQPLCPRGTCWHHAPHHKHAKHWPSQQGESPGSLHVTARSTAVTGRSPLVSAHPSCSAATQLRGKALPKMGVPGTPGLTLVVLNQLLQRVEGAAWGDVEAAAIQHPDLVMLHRAALHVVPVPHRQGVAACSGSGELPALAWRARPPCAWLSQAHGTHSTITQQSHPCRTCPHCAATIPSAPGMSPAAPAAQIPKAASKQHIHPIPTVWLGHMAVPWALARTLAAGAWDTQSLPHGKAEPLGSGCAPELL